MIDSLLKITEAALSIWDSKRKTKYLEAVFDLKEKIANEKLKDSKRDDAAIDYWERQLFLLADLCATEIKRSQTKDM